MKIIDFKSLVFKCVLTGFALFLAACGGEEKRRAEAKARKMVDYSGMSKTFGKPFAVPSISADADMLWCPPGTFLMGSPRGEERRYENETLHSVTLTRGFWLGKHEVTQAQWEKVMGGNPSYFMGPNRPVVDVSWEDAVAFCKKLTDMELKAGRVPKGWAYQLPTEAQWEYTCRAGTQTRFAFGDELTVKQANFDENVDETTEVGKYPTNAWDFYDMHGNAWEWCRDWHDDNYYERASAKHDPLGPVTGSRRVTRGGSWFAGAMSARSAYRDNAEPGVAYGNQSFRLSFSVYEQAE